jgi:hypothetical protein
VIFVARCCLVVILGSGLFLCWVKPKSAMCVGVARDYEDFINSARCRKCCSTCEHLQLLKAMKRRCAPTHSPCNRSPSHPRLRTCACRHRQTLTPETDSTNHWSFHHPSSSNLPHEPDKAAVVQLQPDCILPVCNAHLHREQRNIACGHVRPSRSRLAHTSCLHRASHNAWSRTVRTSRILLLSNDGHHREPCRG